MRQISFEEAGAVGGADCGGLTMTVGITGVSISGSLDSWASCAGTAVDWGTDLYNAFDSHSITGIPYGEAHVA